VGHQRFGVAASPGIGIGRAVLVTIEPPPVPDGAPVGSPAEEEERFFEALAKVRAYLEERERYAREHLGETEARIFAAEQMLLNDPTLVEGTLALIHSQRVPAAQAFHWRMLQVRDDFQRRGHAMTLDKLHDLEDIRGLVLRALLGQPFPDTAVDGTPEDPVVLVAYDLPPSLIVTLDPDRVTGLALDVGTYNSHASILARARGIPAVVSLGSLSSEVRTGQRLIVDGRRGVVVLDPTPEEEKAFRDRDFRIREWEQELVLQAHLDPRTLDGRRVALRANIDQPEDARSARERGADGIGLFRTEFLVIGRRVAPDEEEQFAAYREVVELFSDRPVILRTFDLGGDKLPGFINPPPEDNPMLGWRGIRLWLDSPDLARPQARAILRVAALGDVRVMLPMVTSLDEVERARAIFEDEHAALARRGVPVPQRLRLGAMVETPGTALIARELADRVDFLSIGTNDLVQYTLAADRGNAKIVDHYQPLHPAVLRLIDHVVRAGAERGIEVNVCGEMASVASSAYLLVGLGVEALSVNVGALAEIKKLIRSVRYDDARRVAQTALQRASANEVAADVDAAFAAAGLDPSLFGRYS
jgi:phosphotransferase system enzyme I (PtsI)